MEILFFISTEKCAEVKNKVFSDEVVSRQSIQFRDNRSLSLPKEGYYLKISGEKEAIKKARSLLKLKNLGEELKGKEKVKILKIIKNQEQSAAQAFGAIFK